MYICICKAVTDGQIRQAIHEGACTRKQLIECLNVGRDCGKCNPEVRELLNIHAPRVQAPACGHSKPLALSARQEVCL
ncbi:Bacterioferritin-associated ferredoxin [Anaerolineae bacterium]|nr:Bacterioferritin-associated ferredoxin [Anaerolineae bacterium]